MSNPPFTYKFYTTTAQAWDAMYQAILGAQKSIFGKFIFYWMTPLVPGL